MDKYILLNESLKAISKNVFNLLILKGSAGFGKSHNTLEFLRKLNIDFAYINAYSTPLKFYELLYLNKDKKIIVFDDVQSIDNPLIINFLKSACWSVLDNNRKISYLSTSEKFEKLNVPIEFDFFANIILIFNDEIKEYAPIINRGVQIDFNFNFNDKIKIFEEYQKKAEIEEEVLKYVQSNCDESTKNLSIRSLVILSKLKREGFDFKLFANEMFKGDEDIKYISELVSKCQSATSACEEWIKQTGKSRRSFFRLKKKLNL